MKNSLVLLLLTCLAWHLQTTMAISPSPKPIATTPAIPPFGTDHFIAECTAFDAAIITVENGYTAVSHQGCAPSNSHATGGDLAYTLSSSCIGGTAAFIIRPTESIIVVKGTIYSLSCIDDVKDDYVVSVTAVIQQLKEPTGTAISEQGHVTHKPPGLEMEVLTTDPSGFTAYSEFTSSNGDVYLGQKVYLTIFHDSSSSSGLTSLIPLNCQAKSAKSVNLPLWNLTDSSATSTNRCVLEPSVMSGSFAYQHTTAGDFTHVEMEAFQFQGETTKEITISCSVRICISVNPGSQCEKDNTALSACDSTTTVAATATASATPTTSVTASAAAITVARKRRDVIEQDDSSVGRGSLHRVTATLRIRDDVMATGGCSSVLYTVSCLVLAVLVAIIT